jgi:hypothetical protein
VFTVSLIEGSDCLRWRFLFRKAASLIARIGVGHRDRRSSRRRNIVAGEALVGGFFSQIEVVEG